MSALLPIATAKADICASSRFTSESRHVQCGNACPLWAISGHPHLINHFVGEPNSARGTAMLSTFTFEQVQTCLPVRLVSSLSLGVVTSSNVTKVNRGGLACAIVIRHSCRAGC